MLTPVFPGNVPQRDTVRSVQRVEALCQILVASALEGAEVLIRLRAPGSCELVPQLIETTRLLERSPADEKTTDEHAGSSYRSGDFQGATYSLRHEFH